MQRDKKVFVADGSSSGVSRTLNLLSYSSHAQVVGFAHDVTTTLHSVRALNPEILIMDLQMRGGGGLSLLSTLKRDFPGIVVIVLTNASHDQYRKRCLEAGADYFFDKSTQFWNIHDVLSPFPDPDQ